MKAESRIGNSLKNISFGLLTQVIQMLLGFVTRTIFIKYLAVEYLGVNGLFSSILTMLSLTELGITSAVLFALYGPLAGKEEKKIAGLVYFLKKVYTVIALIIGVLGLVLLPFLDRIVDNPPTQILQDLNIIYLLFLFNTVVSYFFQYKLSLFHADQKSYVLSKRNIIVFVCQNIGQIISLILFQNFLLYLLIQLISQLLGNLYLTVLVKKYYPFLNKYKNEFIEPEIKKQIFSNVKSTALVKIGGLLVNNSTNIILNYFSGLVMVGLLSNYNLLVGLASGLIMQVFSGLTASIAHVNVTETLEKKRETFKIVNFANFWVYGFVSVLIIVTLNDFIFIWIGQKYVLPQSIVILMAINFYMVGMQNSVWTFKATFGFFKEGRFLVMLTAILNLVFAFVLGKYFGLFGILLAMILARLLTNIWYDPYIVLKKGLQQDAMQYAKKYFGYFFILIGSLLFIRLISNFIDLNGIWNIILNIVLSLIIVNGFIILLFKSSVEFNYLRSVSLNIINKIRT